jgi:hypothetical protein
LQLISDKIRGLKFIYDDTDSTYEELLTKSKLPTLKIRRIRTIAIETFKIGNKTSPLCLHDLITIKQSNFRPLDCIFSILFVFCSLQKCQLSDMIDALIKRVSVTYKCYEMCPRFLRIQLTLLMTGKNE